jgi:hypothetical protein
VDVGRVDIIEAQIPGDLGVPWIVDNLLYAIKTLLSQSAAQAASFPRSLHANIQFSAESGRAIAL